VLPLETSAPRKLLSVRLGKEREVLFAFGLGAKPAEKDMDWSGWIAATHPVGSTPPAADAAFYMRYRVQKEPPPAKVLTREEEDAQRLAGIRAEFSALAPDAPLAAWLGFTHYRNPEDVQKAAGAAIRKRPRLDAELAEVLQGPDKELARLALWSFQFLPDPPASVAPAVAAFGDGIIVSLRALVESAPDDRRTLVDATSLEFSDWMVAVRALQEQSNSSFTSQLQEIATLARRCPDDYAIQMSVLRVASFYLQKWAGIAPLPGDPPPR